MLMILTPEESVENRQRLLNDIGKAILDKHLNGYPKNFRLYNALLHVMSLWREAPDD